MIRFAKAATLVCTAVTTLAVGVYVVFEYDPGLWLIEQEGHFAAALVISLPLVIIGALAGFFSFVEYHGIGPQDGIVRLGPRRDRDGRPLIALTFDDGPNPVYTPQILDILKDRGVKASFFMTGRNVVRYPDMVRRVASEGHDIGNHTYSHRDLVPSTRKAVLGEVMQTERAFQNVLGYSTTLFRPPRGLYSNAVRQLLLEQGYTIVLWSVSSVDWQLRPAKRIARRVIRYAQEGGIVLFHDSGAVVKKEGGSRMSTVKCLPLVIDLLRERGFEIVPVSRMLEVSGEASRLEPAMKEV